MTSYDYMLHVVAGVEISKEVTISAFVMLVTMIPYFVIQSADWYFGPTLVKEQQPGYVQAAALITFILSITGIRRNPPQTPHAPPYFSPMPPQKNSTYGRDQTDTS